jgi:hypothetical protein
MRVLSALAVAAAAATALGAAAPAGASVSSAPGAARQPVAVSASWPSAERGIALSYPTLSTGARPSLFMTGNGGRSWHKLPAPPVGWPADNDMPDATWAAGVIAVTNGTSVVASHDAGRHWAKVRLAGLPTARTLFVGHIAVAHGRMFTVVTTASAGTSTATVYSGPAAGGTMRAVSGLSVSGSTKDGQFGAYGDLTAAGGLQVSLGVNYASSHYWLSGDGVHFTKAPAPCGAGTAALLGGAPGGKPVALCSTEPSSAGAGSNTHRVWAAPRLGGRFAAAGPSVSWYNQQAFAAATDRDMAMAGAPSLDVTANAGHTWSTRLLKPNGAFWSDLAFPSGSTGAVVGVTVNSSLKAVGAVYRTVDGGHTWHALTLP